MRDLREHEDAHRIPVCNDLRNWAKCRAMEGPGAEERWLTWTQEKEVLRAAQARRERRWARRDRRDRIGDGFGAVGEAIGMALTFAAMAIMTLAVVAIWVEETIEDPWTTVGLMTGLAAWVGLARKTDWFPAGMVVLTVFAILRAAAFAAS